VVLDELDRRHVATAQEVGLVVCVEVVEIGHDDSISRASFLGATASQATVMTYSSSSRLISPSRDCCTITAL
jgi:hypothetical protein